MIGGVRIPLISEDGHVELALAGRRPRCRVGGGNAIDGRRLGRREIDLRLTARESLEDLTDIGVEAAAERAARKLRLAVGAGDADRARSVLDSISLQHRDFEGAVRAIGCASVRARACKYVSIRVG